MLIFRVFCLSFFLTLICSVTAQAHLHRKHVCDAYAQTKTLVIVDPARTFKNRDDFFKAMAKDPRFAIAYTRCIGRAIDRFKFLKKGFRLEFGEDEVKKFVIKLKGAEFNVIKQPIFLEMPYDPVHSFTDILADKSTKETRFSEHTVMVRSYSKNVLLLPRKGYVSFYDFAKKASPAEIVDIWKQASTISDELVKNNRPFVFTTHAGTSMGQTVPHLHLRFELEK